MELQRFCLANGALVSTDNSSIFEPKHIVDRVYKMFYLCDEYTV